MDHWLHSYGRYAKEQAEYEKVALRSGLFHLSINTATSERVRVRLLVDTIGNGLTMNEEWYPHTS